MARTIFRPEPGEARRSLVSLAPVFPLGSCPQFSTHFDKLDFCPPPQDQGEEGAARDGCPPSPPYPLDCQAGPLQGLQAPHHPHHLPPCWAHGARLQVGSFLHQGAEEGRLVGNFLRFQGRRLPYCFHIPMSVGTKNTLLQGSSTKLI